MIVRFVDEQSYIILTPWTQERPRHLQNEQSSIILTELPEHKKDHDINKIVDVVVFLVFWELGW
jgi:hypothetical protein